ncbi:MAG: hypothetical protein ACREQI_07215 [Candidatus Binataceae bacterium]
MNQQPTVKIKGYLEADALRILRDTPGITVIAGGPKRGADHRADAVVRFAGKRANVTVEVKRRANAATAWQLVHRAKAHPATPLLVVAGDTTTEARQILQDHGVAVVDGLGNAHIALPGLLLHVEGRRPPRATTTGGPPMRLSGKAGVAAQALLLNPNRTWQVHDLAKEARISVGLAHRVLARLETEGILAAEGKGPNRMRRVTNPTALLDLYAEENVAPPIQTQGFLLAQTPTELIDRLATNLGRGGIEYAVTGAAAASVVAPFVTAIPVVKVWVTAKVAAEELHKGSQAKAVTNGANVVFLQRKGDAPLVLRERTKNLRLVNRFQLYADLLRDPQRGREQADHLRREVIKF